MSDIEAIRSSIEEVRGHLTLVDNILSTLESSLIVTPPVVRENPPAVECDYDDASLPEPIKPAVARVTNGKVSVTPKDKQVSKPLPPKPVLVPFVKKEEETVEVTENITLDMVKKRVNDLAAEGKMTRPLLNNLFADFGVASAKELDQVGLNEFYKALGV